MQSIEQLFTINEEITDDTSNGLPLKNFIFVKVDSYYKLFPCSEAIMDAASIKIFKRLVVSADLVPYAGLYLVDSSAVPVPEVFNASITTMDQSVFVGKPIATCSTALEFYNLVCTAAEACVDIAELLDNQAYLIWLAQMEMTAIKQWKDKKYYLSNSDSYILTEHVLKYDPTVIANDNAGAFNYPVDEKSIIDQATQAKTNFDIYNPIEWTPMLTEDQWEQLFIYLYANDATLVANRIIRAILPNPGTYPELIRGKLLPLLFANSPMITEKMYWYAARIMFRDELSMYQKRGRGVAGHFLRNGDDVCAISKPTICTPEAGGNFFHPYVKPDGRHNTFDYPQYIAGKRGIFTTAQTADRINRFTNGVFANTNWSGELVTNVTSEDITVSSAIVPWKMALTGSTITACAVINPLNQLMTDDDYWEEYYPSHSVDIIGENITGIGYSDIDIAVECPFENFDAIVDEFMSNLVSTTPLGKIKIECVIQHRYLITGLPRNIEIFQVNNIACAVVKYHVAPVRAFWDGSALWCFPTFVSAAYTAISIDIRWARTIKNPCDIIMKYFQRGFAFRLTNVDSTAVMNHIRDNPVWTREPNNIGSARYGRPFAGDHWIFNPSTYNIGIHADLDKPSKMLMNLIIDYSITIMIGFTIPKIVRETMGVKSIKRFPHNM